MNCEKAMDSFLELDKGDFVPPMIAFHLLLCSSCRKEMFRFRAMENAASDELELVAPIPLDDFSEAEEDDPLISSILSKTSSLNAYPIPEVKTSLFPWILAGLIMLLSFSVFSSLPLGVWGLKVLGEAFKLPLYLIFGLVTAVYCGLFIGTHMDFFIKRYKLSDDSGL